MTAHDVAFEDPGPWRYLMRRRQQRRRRRLIAGGAVLLLVGGTFALWPTLPAPSTQKIESTPPNPILAASSEELLAPSEGQLTPNAGRSNGLQPGLRLLGASAPELLSSDTAGTQPVPVAADQLASPEVQSAPPPMPSVDSLIPPAAPGSAEAVHEATGRPAPSSQDSRLRVTSLKPPRPVTASARQAPAAAPRPSVAKPIYLQLSAFSDESNARRAAATLRASLGDILPGVSLKIDRGVANDKPVWRLRAGPFSTLEHGTTACSRIKRRNGTCLVVAS